MFKHTLGKKFNDILTKSSYRTSINWVENYPITLTDKKGNHIEKYDGFSVTVTGISGLQTFTNSPIIEIRYVFGWPSYKTIQRRYYRFK